MLFFSALDGTHNWEPWKSDGTSSGTVLVKDINSGASGSSPSCHTVFGNTVFFYANDGSTSWELWQSNGTSSGTTLVQDINSGGSGSHPCGFIPLGTTLFFYANDGTNGAELWALDPANITGLSSSSGSGSGGGITNVTGATCSVSPALPTGLSIDSSTCTISGTPTVASSNTTYTVTAVISGVTYQTSVWLSSSYLELTPSVEGADLYVDTPMTNITFHYDANAASGSSSGSIVGPYNGNGTAWMVRDLNPYSSTGTNPSQFTAFDNTLYFSGSATNFGTELMKSDGTSSGTVMVKDINSGSGHANLANPQFTAVGAVFSDEI